jgi:hypothetical protein
MSNKKPAKRRVRVQLTYTADFDDDFDMSTLQNVDKLIAFGVVAFLREELEQSVDILPNAKLKLSFVSVEKERVKGR